MDSNNNLRNKVTALAMASAIAASGSSVGNNNKSNDDPLLESHIEHEKKQIEYYNFIQNEDLSDYDQQFVNFYRNGIIKINDREYPVTDIYLESGIIDGLERHFIIYYKYPNNDIITNESKDNFKRSNVILFSNTYCFYEIYLLYRSFIINNTLIVDKNNVNTILQEINLYDGTIHAEVPETAYGRVIKHSSK